MSMMTVGLLACDSEGTNGYMMLRSQVSTDGLTWSSTAQVAPGGSVQVRIVAGYEGRDALHGLAWVNFQPTISEWWGDFDRVLPFATSGNQDSGQVAYDKPVGGQQAFGRVYPFAATAQGPSAGGFDTTLMTYTTFTSGTRQMRIAQARTNNEIGAGPTTGPFAYNNTNGAGGILCAQPAMEQAFDGVRNALLQDIVLFKFAVVVDPTLSERNMRVNTPLGGVSKFGQSVASAGWFTTAQQSGLDVAYIPVVAREATIQVRGPIPSPGGVGVFVAMGLFACRRRR